MNIAFNLSVACYALYAILSLAFGVIYLTRRQFMPYHREALGVPWSEVDPRTQTLILALMRVAGGGWLAAGASVALLLIFPFLGGELWSLYALPAVGLLIALPSLYATILVRARTGAHPPVAAGAVGVALLVAGFVLSFY